jgi:tetratricopeptide (TPR) repeat protein
MSLLIKALDKAEKAQLDQQKLEREESYQESRRRAENIANNQEDEGSVTLSLADVESENSATQTSFVGTQYSGEHTSERANNMFAAKVEPVSEMRPIVWIVLFGVLSFLAIVGYFYYQLNVANAPATPVSNPPALPASTSQQPPIATQSQVVQAPRQDAAISVQSTQTTNTAARDADKTSKISNAQQASNTNDIVIQDVQSKLNKIATGSTATATEVRRSLPVMVVPTIASQSASIQVSKSQSPPTVSPVLINAYNAYLAGNNQEAQSLYKRVLQRDTRNVDALLGMGAIAEREGRVDDALGWYQKVLEIDPKNTTALSAYAASVVQDDQTSALKLKSMLAENPNDANAHANLGAYFAGQAQWAEAQQSYFEAYRLNATAENTFNLAVSLDQMGKPALALPYYQQALAQVSASPSSTIDIAALQARIAAIQSQ